MNTTPLHEAHEACGARMTTFGGWEMPVQYEGILAEHRHTRSQASLFDTCHMSQFRVEGPGAEDALASALACRIRALHQGQSRYGFLLNCGGGVVDDLVCYRLGEDRYMVVCNAGNREDDYKVLDQRAGEAASVRDVTDETAMLALQGPKSARVLKDLYDVPVEELRYFWFRRMELGGTEVILSRTGYTGELGFELYFDASAATSIWEELLEHPMVRPAGLGARDTLRMEMGLCLYGHELDESITPLEAGLEMFLPEGEGYVGSEAIARQRQEGMEVRRVGVRFEGRRAARPEDVFLVDEREVGSITSGAFAPSLSCAIAMGYVEAEAADPGQQMEAAVRAKRISGRVVKLPFYSGGTATLDLKNGDLP